MSRITTHVLDTARGIPAAGIAVVLEREQSDAWHPVGRATTDPDGRTGDLTSGTSVEPGRFRLTFETGAYLGPAAFFPSVTVVFDVRDTARPHHVPLLLSPFGYSTYRGS